MQDNNFKSVQVFKCVKVTFSTFRLLSVQQDGQPQLGWALCVQKPGLRYGWDFSANNFGGASGLFRSSYHLRSVARIIGILEQNALTMKWLQSFWNAHVDPVSAIRYVKVNVGYEPFMFIDDIVKQVHCESVRQRIVSLKQCFDKNTTSSIRMARRKTWSESVGERRD